MIKFAKERKLMRLGEEATLVEHIKSLGRRGIPATPKMVKERANAILSKRLGANFEGVGKNWRTRFMKDHPELQLYRSTKLEKARANGLNPGAIWSFEEAVEEIYKIHKPSEDCIFGMDETGLMLGTGPSELVYGEAGNRHQHSQEDGNRELVTSIVTICADGTQLKDVIIFQGQNLWGRWIRDNPGDLRCLPWL